MNRKQPRKRPQPSFTEGRIRDPKIEGLQDKDFSRDKFLAVVKKAATSVEKQSRSDRGSHKDGD